MKTGLLFFIAISLFSCTSFQRASDKTAKSQGPRDFSAALDAFLAAPSDDRLEDMQKYFKRVKAGEDTFLTIFAFERSLDTPTLEKVNQAFEKEPTVTFQMLFLLAYEVPTLRKFQKTETLYQEWVQRHREPGQKVVIDNIPQFLSGDAAIEQTDALFTALDDTWESASPGQKVRLLEGLSDYGVDDPKFVAAGYSNHTDFIKAKRKKWVEAMKGNEDRQEMYTLFTGTRLAHLEPSALPEIRRFLTNPTELALVRLKQACLKISKSEPSSSVDELTAAERNAVTSDLERGDVVVARAVALLADKDCLRSTEHGEGPVGWLGSSLICHYPEILVEAFATEGTPEPLRQKIMEYENPEQQARCDHDQDFGSEAAQKIGPAPKSFLDLKLRALARVQTKNAAESELLDKIFSHYQFSDQAAKLRLPAASEDEAH